MPPSKTKFRYEEEDLRQAIFEVQQGTSVAAAARSHGIPRTTLIDKLKGKSSLERRLGRHSVLTKDEEGILVNWILSTAKAGFPVTIPQVCSSVQQLVKKLGRENPFTDDRPGRKWVAAFLKRNPQVSIRTAENLTISRASISKERIRSWYGEVFEFLKENGYEGILNDPNRIFNGDETAFFLCPSDNKVLAKKGDKSVYLNVNSDDKECLTVLITANAVGTLAPPLIIFKYERIPGHILLCQPTGWGTGRSESGWMTGETFYEFMGNVFSPWLIQNKIPLPVIFFMDGHVSHMTLHLSILCREKGIILIALPPNATHMIQPMDVSVFRTLKEGWRVKVHEWRVKNMENPQLKKQHFAALLSETLNERITPTVVSNGFRKCGLFPWNPLAISFSESTNDKNLPRLKPSVQRSGECRYKEAQTVFEELIGAEKVEKFSFSSTWDGSIEDKSLYNLWWDLKMKIESLTTCVPPNLESPRIENGVEIEALAIPEVGNISMHHDQESQDTGYDLNNTPQIEGNNNLPSPFKNVLLWPPKKEEIGKPTKRKREQLPSVVTSDQFIKYHHEKEIKKQAAEEAKKEKLAIRLRKKEEKAEQIRIKKEEREKAKRNRILQRKKPCKKKTVPVWSSDSDEGEQWVPSGDSCDDVSLDLGEDNERDEEYSITQVLEIGGRSDNIMEDDDTSAKQETIETTPQDLENKAALEEDTTTENQFNNSDIPKCADFIIARIESRKKQESRKLLCQVLQVYSHENIDVMPLNACNRLKTVFSIETKSVYKISIDHILCKLNTPLAFGNSDKRYQFPTSLSVD